MKDTELYSELSRAKAIVNKCMKHVEDKKSKRVLSNMVIDFNRLFNEWEMTAVDYT